MLPCEHLESNLPSIQPHMLQIAKFIINSIFANFIYKIHFKYKINIKSNIQSTSKWIAGLRVPKCTIDDELTGWLGNEVYVCKFNYAF